MKNCLIIVLTFCMKSILTSQNSVRINVFILGEFCKNEKYAIEYNAERIHSFKPERFDLYSFYLDIDTTVIKNYTYLPLIVIKIGKHHVGEDTKLNVIWEPNKTILLIERNFRLKDKYAFSYRWLDRKRDIGILAEVYDEFMHPELFHRKPNK